MRRPRRETTTGTTKRRVGDLRREPGVRAALELCVGATLDGVTWGADAAAIRARDAAGDEIRSVDALKIACGVRPAWRPSAIAAAPVPEREQIVEQLVNEGRTTTEIADVIGVSERTVTTLRRRVRERVGVPVGPASSKGVSVIGAVGLTREVVAECLSSLRDDVNPGRMPLDDDRVRVMISPSKRDLTGAFGTPLVVLGPLPEGVTVEQAVRGGMVANGSYEEGPDRWTRLVDLVVQGDVGLSHDVVARLVGEMREVRDQRALTSREHDVIDGIRRGESTKQTARRLSLTAKTIQNRRHQLYLRFGVGTARELVTLIDQRNLDGRRTEASDPAGDGAG